MYFDTSANKMKVYNGTTNAWDDVASVGSFMSTLFLVPLVLEVVVRRSTVVLIDSL